MSSRLFSPIELRGLRLSNRIVVSPMCQYSAVDGSANDWHMQNLGSLALSGAGLVMIEATHVTAQGRITHGCLGLYSDANEAAIGRLLAFCRRFAPETRIGIQIAHAGWKASAQLPWFGSRALTAEQHPWQTVAPSALPFGEGWHVPKALEAGELDAIREAFVAAARRAARLGLDLIELHAAHGYLLHEFLSPLSNRRADRYGGSLENRMRFPLEVAEAVRAAWPAERPMGARITGQDWLPDGLTPEDAVAFARALKVLGLDYVCVSSGGIHPKTNVPSTPGYNVPMARQVRAETGIVTRTVGMIADPLQAETIIAKGEADLVALARAMIDDPRWPWHAAEELEVEIAYPPQYQRGQPKIWPGARLARSRVSA
jgi:2,4-dienoyl-CoA reductase-like NADH-dependent reductase (Old Yellow Enzyme family)